jgi:hypothetical protein
MKYKIGDVVICHDDEISAKKREKGVGWKQDRVFKIARISKSSFRNDILWEDIAYGGAYGGVYDEYVKPYVDTADNFNKRAFRS